MKTKAKQKKHQSCGKKPQAAPKRAGGAQVPGEWLYATPLEGAPERIYRLLKDSPWDAEYWAEAGVLEIGLPGAGSVDLEDLGGTLGNEEDDGWLREQGARSVCAVTIRPEDFPEARKVMEYIGERLGGCFCGDTDDFEPQVRAPRREEEAQEHG
ncbi:MAG: hypothetical protein Q4C82_01680 [Eubacteriales bacterium]|nr:hypothetical protein [Eubacteriales bacterium]